MLYLIFLDLFWFAAALCVDAHKLPSIPFYLWPMVLVCPIYPLLLALTYFSYLKKRKPNAYLLAFAALPSAVFGVLALIYYGAQLYYTKFSLNEFGQIFWVLFYSFQGWYLLLKEKMTAAAVITACLYLIAKFVIDIRYQTFGYLDIANLPDHVQVLLFTLAVGLSVALTLYKLTKK